MEKLTKEILKHSKWQVTPEQSERLQEAAFELGFSWRCYGTTVVLTNHPQLYFDNDFRIRYYIDDKKYFEEHKNTERKFEDYFEDESQKGTFFWAVNLASQGKKMICDSLNNRVYISRSDNVIDTFFKHDNARTHYKYIKFEIINDTTWREYEENTFGKFKVDAETNNVIMSDESEVICPNDFDDLEKAIKRAREMKR